MNADWLHFAYVFVYTQVGSIFEFFRSQILETIDMTFFFSPKTFLGVGKHRFFRRNI